MFYFEMKKKIPRKNELDLDREAKVGRCPSDDHGEPEALRTTVRGRVDRGEVRPRRGRRGRGRDGAWARPTRAATASSRGRGARGEQRRPGDEAGGGDARGHGRRRAARGSAARAQDGEATPWGRRPAVELSRGR